MANASLLLPYMGSFVRFLGQLIDENHDNTKVMIHLLQVHGVLLESFLSPQSAHKQQNSIIQNLFEIGFEAKAQVCIFVTCQVYFNQFKSLGN